MNASAKGENEHRAYICLGSNIDPPRNLRAALRLLREQARIVSLSTCWQTQAVGTTGPDFINMAACILTPLEPEALKAQVLRPIESQLGRVRGADKYAPRPIDLDITLYDDRVLDPELWRRAYLALVFSELLPHLTNPETGETLPACAARLRENQPARQIPAVALDR